MHIPQNTRYQSFRSDIGLGKGEVEKTTIWKYGNKRSTVGGQVVWCSVQFQELSSLDLDHQKHILLKQSLV